MAKRSKFFCIAVEGATCDGRTLDRNALQEMAEGYDPKTYSARVNMEHIRGFSAEPPFNAYGDVVALETREVELQLGGKAEKKLGLFAQVDALDNLVAVQAKGQKLYSSIELNPNFAATGKAYLQGLAVTDSPASLGTEIMEFAAGRVKEGKTNPFAERKHDAGNFFSAAREIDGLEFQPDGSASESSKLIKLATDFFSKFTPSGDDGAPAPAAPTPSPAPAPTPSPAPGTPTPANDNFAQLAQGMQQLTAAIEQRFTKIEASIEQTPGGAPTRPIATGATGNFAKTDC